MKKIITAALALCCVALFWSIIAFATNNEDMSDHFFRFGQIEREYLDFRGVSLLRNDDVFIESAHFVIYESEITLITERHRLGGADDGRERAIRSLLRREVLYHEALSRGFYTSDTEIRDMIDLNIEATRSSDNFESDVMAFLDALGMTNEEYWETQADIFRKELTILKFMEAELESIAISSRLADQEAIEDSLQNYLQSLIDNYVVSNSLEWALTER